MSTLSPRLTLLLEAGIERNCACPETLRSLFRRARDLGLTSAEVDAALNGGSFEVKAAAAVALACALKDEDPTRTENARRAGARAGFSVSELAFIESFVRDRLGSSQP